MEQINTFLNKLGILNDDNKVSITNIVVMIFVLITAIRSLFAGMTLSSTFFTWKILDVDFANALPLLFALLNYSHKRSELNKTVINTDEENK